jgi:hypothetical protein
MRASLQPFTGYIVRFHPEGDFGDDYVFMTCVEFKGDTATFHGGAGDPSPAMKTELNAMLRERGIKHIAFERRRGGKHRRNVKIKVR